MIMEDGDSFTARIVAVRTWTPALGADDFLVVDGSALRAGLKPPTGLLVTGDHPDAAVLKKAAGGDAQVRLRSAVIDATVESPCRPAPSASTRPPSRRAPPTPHSPCCCPCWAPHRSGPRCWPACAPWASPGPRAGGC